MDDASCELIGFQKRHTKGSLWRLLRDIHEEGVEEEREGGTEGEVGAEAKPTDGRSSMQASVERGREKEKRERARERERAEKEEERLRREEGG
jgi:hypothetical protein